MNNREQFDFHIQHLEKSGAKIKDHLVNPITKSITQKVSHHVCLIVVESDQGNDVHTLYYMARIPHGFHFRK
jgi:hypothetical protein